MLSTLAALVVLGQVSVQVSLPSIRFEVAPPLVVVQPGIQVVEDYDDEVFVVSGYYWSRRGDRWYRARDWRGGWVVVDSGRVPPGLVKLQPGVYRKWKPVKVKVKGGKGHGHGKHRG